MGMKLKQTTRITPERALEIFGTTVREFNESHTRVRVEITAAPAPAGYQLHRAIYGLFQAVHKTGSHITEERIKLLKRCSNIRGPITKPTLLGSQAPAMSSHLRLNKDGALNSILEDMVWEEPTIDDPFIHEWASEEGMTAEEVLKLYKKALKTNEFSVQLGTEMEIVRVFGVEGIPTETGIEVASLMTRAHVKERTRRMRKQTSSKFTLTPTKDLVLGFLRIFSIIRFEYKADRSLTSRPDELTDTLELIQLFLENLETENVILPSWWRVSSSSETMDSDSSSRRKSMWNRISKNLDIPELTFLIDLFGLRDSYARVYDLRLEHKTKFTPKRFKLEAINTQSN